MSELANLHLIGQTVALIAGRILCANCHVVEQHQKSQNHRHRCSACRCSLTHFALSYCAIVVSGVRLSVSCNPTDCGQIECIFLINN